MVDARWVRKHPPSTPNVYIKLQKAKYTTAG